MSSREGGCREKVDLMTEKDWSLLSELRAGSGEATSLKGMKREENEKAATRVGRTFKMFHNER